jgi:hypothetical protein
MTIILKTASSSSLSLNGKSMLEFGIRLCYEVLQMRSTLLIHIWRFGFYFCDRRVVYYLSLTNWASYGTTLMCVQEVDLEYRKLEDAAERSLQRCEVLREVLLQSDRLR